MENKLPITKNYYLYGLYCPYTDNLKYIGITTGSLNNRLNSHLRKPTNREIALWFRNLKNNSIRPIIKLIKEFDNYDDLLSGEINEIKKYRELDFSLYNVADGGDINPMLGKTHTIESRLKISSNNKGLKRTDKQKDERKIILKDLWNNKEWSDNVRKKMIGNKNTLGYRHTEETKKTISEKNKGKEYFPRKNTFFHSEETKKMMSELMSGENNPMYGKILPKEVLLKRSIKVKENGTFKGKKNPNFKYNIIKSELIDLYADKKMTLTEISTFYGCSYQLIVKKIIEFKLKRENNRKKYFFDIDKINDYLDNGLKQVEISKIYGCNPKLLNKFIKKHIKNG
jgi:hypothetical protein